MRADVDNMHAAVAKGTFGSQNLQNSRHFCPSIWSYTHAEIEESSPLFLIAAIVSATQDVLNKTIHCHKT